MSAHDSSKPGNVQENAALEEVHGKIASCFMLEAILHRHMKDETLLLGTRPDASS